jgi:Pvc16 N-terminal domain
MLHLLDESLEAFLRAEVPLPPRDVDVVFDAPDGDWASGVSRPTVNLYLWDVRPNLAEREFGQELVNGSDGRRYRRNPLPRVDCRYLVTAWTTEVRDEHSLLGDVLAALLLHREVEPDHLRGPFADLRPLPSVLLRSGDGSENSDFWSALGGQLKPGLDLLITATVDAALRFRTGPPVQEVLPTVRGSVVRGSVVRGPMVDGSTVERSGT